MSNRYDTRTTMFSPQGRLFQVEYAMEAISHAPTSVAVLSKEGIVLAAENRETSVSKLIQPQKHSEKIYLLDDHVACSVAGITSDANTLIKYLRGSTQRYRQQYDESMPCEQLVQSLCNLKQSYTQFGGQRPFGCSFLYAGWDVHHGYQLYKSDPSGNYAGWKATCIGANEKTAESVLKQEYKVDCTQKEALLLAIKVMSKTMDGSTLTSAKLDFAVLTRDDSGKCKMISLTNKEVDDLIKEADLKKAEE